MEIEWTEPALNDMEEIRDYISRDSKFYAKRLIDNIFSSIEKLSDFPEIGRYVPEIKDKNIREIFFYPYRIIYRIEDEYVLILSVIHGARDLSKGH
ncbi:MAG: type II toxin-antitoxin system RelE/ParE family toxin [Candidatus Aminicenantes bacterium]|nr:type II toxin-antitoxin system RelE/ParE family toxin [Candidatus Aminicenantes bacterium]